MMLRLALGFAVICVVLAAVIFSDILGGGDAPRQVDTFKGVHDARDACSDDLHWSDRLRCLNAR